jgi:hypothetical protein
MERLSAASALHPSGSGEAEEPHSERDFGFRALKYRQKAEAATIAATFANRRACLLEGMSQEF